LKKELVIALLLSSMLVIEPVFAYGEEQGSSERNFVARVIFAEAGPSCSDNELGLVASVMVGRIGHQGFGNGKLKTMYHVALQSGAFSCIGDIKNENWAKSADPDKLNEAEKSIWDYCYSLAGGNFQQHYGPSGRPIVYYHDKSISKPSLWDNQYWSAVMELETDHFIFYSVLPAKAAASGASVGTQQNTMVTLTLYIHDGSRDGPMILGAHVTGQDGSGNSFQQTTDSNGCVIITGESGTWSFAASADGYEANSWSQPITYTDTKDAFLTYSVASSTGSKSSGFVDPGVAALMQQVASGGKGESIQESASSTSAVSQQEPVASTTRNSESSVVGKWKAHVEDTFTITNDISDNEAIGKDQRGYSDYILNFYRDGTFTLSGYEGNNYELENRGEEPYQGPDMTGKWVQNGNTVRLQYDNTEGWTEEMTISGDMMIWASSYDGVEGYASYHQEISGSAEKVDT